MKKIRNVLATLLIIIAILLLNSCMSKKITLQKFQAEYFDFFDTITSVIVYTVSEEEFKEIDNAIKEGLLEYNQLYDIYNSYEEINNIKTINDNAGIRPVKVDEKIIELILYAKEMHKRTEGKVNIAFGSVLQTWHKYRTEGIEYPQNAKVPELNELIEANAYTDISKIEVDEENKTVFLQEKNMKLDVGAIAKGYAIEKVAENIKNLGYNNVLFNAGGNVYSLDSKPDGSSWKVGIQNPELDSGELYIKKIELDKGAVVTSGDYQRFYEVNGERYCHIIDVNTLMPAYNFKSVTLYSESSMEADALSTAIFTMSYDEGIKFIEEYKKKYDAKIEAMWIMNDGSMKYTEKFRSYVVE